MPQHHPFALIFVMLVVVVAAVVVAVVVVVLVVMTRMNMRMPIITILPITPTSPRFVARPSPCPHASEQQTQRPHRHPLHAMFLCLHHPTALEITMDRGLQCVSFFLEVLVQPHLAGKG